MHDSSNKILAARLREACTIKPNNVGLPSGIAFELSGSTVRMQMSAKGITAEMQSDAACFEGWALALNRWLGISDIELRWDYDGDENEKRYQQFLFRADQFRKICPWFHIAYANERLHLQQLKTNQSGPFSVTSEKASRETSDEAKCDSQEKAFSKESLLECYIRDNPENLIGLFGITQLYRQLPVGLFMGEVSEATRLFPGSKSAIDLWGTDRDGSFFLFELKKPRQPMMGIISELLFYSYIIEGLRQGHFILQKPNPLVTAKGLIRGYILTTDWHPLIDAELLRAVNSGFTAAGSDIRLGAVRIVRRDPLFYQLEIPATDLD